MNKILLGFIISFCTVCADASIVLNTNAGLGEGDGFGAEYSLFTYETEAIGSGPMGSALININNTELSHLGGVMGTSPLTLSISAFGDEIGTGTPFHFASIVDVGYGDFYISVLPYDFGTPPPPEARGWVLLNNSPTGLTMVSSAMEYGSSNLTVGAIPEPASIGLLSLSGLLIYFSRNKMRK